MTEQRRYLHSEKSVKKWLRHCANMTDFTHTNMDGTADHIPKAIILQGRKIIFLLLFWILDWTIPEIKTRLKREKQKSYNTYTSIYIGETQKNWVIHQNGWSNHFKYHLQLKMVLGWGVQWGTVTRKSTVYQGSGCYANLSYCLLHW